jgi:hypothetical protein
MATSPVAFLFNAELPSLMQRHYGGIYDEAFLRGVSISDPTGRSHSSVLRGDVLLHKLATVSERFLFEGRCPGTSETLDTHIFGALISDFLNDLEHQWNTLDLDALGSLLASRNVYCLCLLSLEATLRESIDRHLRATGGYIGAVEIDLGNPFQRYFFAMALLEHAVIVAGRVLLERNGEYHTMFEGAEEFQPGGKRLVRDGMLQSFRPDVLVSTPISERGREAVKRYRLLLHGPEELLH